MKLLITAIASCLIAYAADAPSVTNIAVTHHDGQTFVTWTDPTTGTPANYRYKVYRSLSAITDAPSLAASTLIQTGVFNNSGQQTGQFPYNQTTRQDTGKLMSITASTGTTTPNSCGPGVCGAALAALSGLAVHTATANESAYYAVITTDRTGVETDSPVSVGNNATTVSVAETIATILPLKYYDSEDSTTRDAGVEITGVANRPLFIKLHQSGGCTGNITSGGDLWQLWGDSTMGYQEGIQQIFAVRELHTTANYPTALGQLALQVLPCDTLWTDTGLADLETFWFGYLASPLNHPTGRAWEFSEAVLNRITEWSIAAYGANPNKVYAYGQSMGGWASVSWAWQRRPDLFAAVFPNLPRWNGENTSGILQIPSMLTGGTVNPSAGQVMSDGSTLLSTRMDGIATANVPNCATNRPPIIWGIGRNDTFANWQNQLDAVAALKACHYAFSFAWNNGNHSTGANAINALFAHYDTAYAKNVSYPAFANSSLDSDTASGCSSQASVSAQTEHCYINAGWSWTVTTDSATQWVATISNSGGNATVDITPRNTQAFRPKLGGLVSYNLSTGASGLLRVDGYGLVTLPSASISGTTTVTFTRVPDLFPLPGGVGR
jgi:hypothetical protein